MQKNKTAQERRSGMALIVVVGLIALLVISSVTFAIIMRVERASSANARNTLMARQVTKTAFSQALLALDHYAGKQAYPKWYDEGEISCPWWSIKTSPQNPDDRRDALFWRDTIGSIDHKITASGARAPASVMNYAAEPYLSAGIRHRAYSRSAVWYKNGQRSEPVEKSNIGPEWVAVTSDAGGNEVIGRYAFLILNTTGYLDLAALVKKQFPHFRGAHGPLELSVMDDFFSGNTTFADFKAKNRSYTMLETVADILFKNGYQVTDSDTGGERLGDHSTIFNRSSVFSALSFMPLELATEKSDQENDKYADGKTENREKVYLGIYNPDRLDQAVEIEHLKKHKARIMKAFYDSGLTASSPAYPLTKAQGGSRSSAIRDAACRDCGLAAYELPRKCNSEQAYWAYLGLLDYLDMTATDAYDNEPEGDDDEDKFARPVTEAIPLFNGFMGALEFTRQECFKEIEVNNGTYASDGSPNKTVVKVYDADHIESTIRFNGKVVFANRCMPGTSPEGWTQGNMLIYMDEGDRDTKTVTSEQFIQQCVDDTGMNFDEGTVESASGDGIFMLTEKGEFSLAPEDMVRKISYTSTKQLDASFGYNPNTPGSTHPCELGDEEVTEATFDLPEKIFIGGGGIVYSIEDDGVVIQQAPATGFVEDIDTFIRSSVNTSEKGTKFVVATPADKTQVFRSKVAAEAAFAANPGSATPENSGDHACGLRTWKADILLCGEMIDPRFQHVGICEGVMDLGVPIFVVSHKIEEEEDAWTTYEDMGYTLPEAIDNVMKAETDVEVDDFSSFMEMFKEEAEEFGSSIGIDENYFDVANESGATLFQRALLTDGNMRTFFDGYFDGSYLQNGASMGPKDDFESIWFSMYVKNGHDGGEDPSGDYVGMESVGELGYLPIGPYATIRLFGFQDESYGDGNGVSPFNQLPENTPYHTVLDQFSLRRATPPDSNSPDKIPTIAPVRGLVNPNTADLHALAAVFHNMATVTEGERPKKAASGKLPDGDPTKPLKEEDAKTVAGVLSDTIAETVGTAEYLSDLGVFFQLDDFGDIVENEIQRENLIRNSCGLMTTRGSTFTILVRGEAYSTLFGRSELKDGVGTTLASRSAIAQVWRDTIPDADGNYPIFVQFFKIFDE